MYGLSMHDTDRQCVDYFSYNDVNTFQVVGLENKAYSFDSGMVI